jgi:hypothetical protein
MKYPSVKEIIRRWKVYFNYSSKKSKPTPIMIRENEPVISVNKKFIEVYSNENAS